MRTFGTSLTATTNSSAAFFRSKSLGAVVGFFREAERETPPKLTRGVILITAWPQDELRSGVNFTTAGCNKVWLVNFCDDLLIVVTAIRWVVAFATSYHIERWTNLHVTNRRDMESSIHCGGSRQLRRDQHFAFIPYFIFFSPTCFIPSLSIVITTTYLSLILDLQNYHQFLSLQSLTLSLLPTTSAHSIVGAHR